MTFSLHGIGASKGIAIGRLHVVDRGQLEVGERSLALDEVEREVARFRRALRGARSELQAVAMRELRKDGVVEIDHVHVAVEPLNMVSLEEGKQADLIAVSGSPLAEVAVLQDVQFVMKGGQVYKSPE